MVSYRCETIFFIVHIVLEIKTPNIFVKIAYIPEGYLTNHVLTYVTGPDLFALSRAPVPV